MARKRYGRRVMDQTRMGAAFQTAGSDPRQWISYGIVTAGNEQDEIVLFDEDEGMVLVRVSLQPSKVPVLARVGSQVAGAGEGEYFPFVEGDEVLCAIPEGDERSGVVIIARLNNAVNAFPMDSVAGQDPTTNSFSFRRRRTPYIEEFNGPLTIRTALSEAFINIGTSGNITIRDGEGSAFQISPDLIGYQGPSVDGEAPKQLVQLNLTENKFTIQLDTAIINFDGDNENSDIKLNGSLTIGTRGNFAAEHAMSIENFINIMFTMAPLLNPLLVTPTAIDTVIAAAIAAGVANPYATAVASQAALSTVLVTQLPKTAVPLPSGLASNPGVCSTGLVIG